MTAAALTAHAAIAWLRRHPALSASFRRNHRAGAALLLLAASSHWWPFVFFLVPAISLSAAAGAAAVESGAGEALALASSTLGGLAGIAAVWSLRQRVMLARPGDFSLPFLFPPAAIAAGYLMARCCASAAASLGTVRWRRSRDARHDGAEGAPLLTPRP